jgi:hypothetical protein
MKEVSLDKDNFYYNGQVASSLGMGDGKHIRFTAIDKNYNLNVVKPDGTQDYLAVNLDTTPDPYPIKGSKGQIYSFEITASEPPVTVPRMIVTID